MISLIQPQLLFLYNNKAKIYKTYFITFKNDVTDTKIYELLRYIQKNNKDLFVSDNYEIINDHILLTMSLNLTRGYIQNMLNIKQKICLFSLWNNIDYYSNNESVFNPFLISDIFEKTPNNLILYEVYKNIVNNTIICVVKEEDVINKNICSNGIYNPLITKFVNDIINRDLSDIIDIQLSYETLNKSFYNINWDDSISYYINNIKEKQKCINRYYYSCIYISGDNLCLLDDIDNMKIIKEQTYTSLFIYDSINNYKSLFFIQNDILHINDLNVFQIITSKNQRIYNLITKEKSVKFNVRIEFENITFTDTIDINFETDFFIEPTKKTRNIFIDKSKKINIITANTHIFFPSYLLEYDLYLYITKLIIGLQISHNKVEFQKLNKKQGSRYYSRYCQGIRKPEILASIDDVDLNQFTKENDYFYKTKDENKSGDIFFNKEINKYLTCNEDNLKNIGFINELFQGYNICLPCCYKKIKTNTLIFSKCTSELTDDVISKIEYEPYLHVFKKYRVIMDPSKIGLLLEKVNDLFNPDVKIIYQFDKKNIEESSINEIIRILSKEKSSRNSNSLIKGGCISNDISYNIYSPALKIFSSLNKDEDDYENENENTEQKTLEQKDSKIKNFYNSEINKQLKPLDLDKTEQYLLINKLNKIRLAKNYVIYMATNDLKHIKTLDDILNNDIDKPCIFFNDNNVYFKPSLNTEYYFNYENFVNNVEFYLLIQNKIHILRSLTKISFNHNLIISPIERSFKEKILKKIFNNNPFKFNKQEGNIVFNENYYSYQNEKQNNKAISTKYFYYFPRITFATDTIGYYIVEVLYKKYFNEIYINEDKLILIKKTFIANLLNIIDFEININSYFKNDYSKIKPLLKYLNKRFVNSKELIKIINNDV